MIVTELLKKILHEKKGIGGGYRMSRVGISILDRLYDHSSSS